MCRMESFAIVLGRLPLVRATRESVWQQHPHGHTEMGPVEAPADSALPPELALELVASVEEDWALAEDRCGMHVLDVYVVDFEPLAAAHGDLGTGSAVPVLSLPFIKR